VRCHHILRVFWNFFTVEDDDTDFYETSGGNHLSIQRHIPDDLNVQKYRCGHFESHHSVSVSFMSMCYSRPNLFSLVTAFCRGSTVFKVLCYKSEGRWLDSRWYH